MVATEPLPFLRAPAEAGFPEAHACKVSSLPAPCSSSPRLHFVRGRWGRWEQIHFRVGKRGGGGQKGSLPGGGLARLEEAGAEVAEDSLPEPLRPGQKEAREAGSVAEMTCGPEWEGEPGEGGLGRGLREREIERENWRRGLRERGVLGAGPEGRGDLGLGLKSRRSGSLGNPSREEWSGIGVGRSLTENGEEGY